ncbi:MAG: nicotinate phosphoribosyltransferase [Candidatus Aminicenantes bacterium]|nr:MAG: nicotinate phosphoribosyltransferase [Candidatus Aminicenantes bacterium]
MSQVESLALFTDLYELTMAACYHDYGLLDQATFSLFIRNYPPSRRYFVSAGLADALRYLEDLKFTSEDLEYLEKTALFKPDFLSYLEEFRFTGDVYAIPEGRIFFANEPLLEVTAPLIEAQIIETFIINALNLQVMIATKASRCFQAAWPRKLVDFSLRRTQGADAGMKVARASFIGGFIGTSNVLAGKMYGIPTYGTMAHSFITCFENEIDAFRAFAHTFPDNAVLLVDTYDTLSGTAKAAEVGKEMVRRGKTLKGVRLDSGDIARLSKQVRNIFSKSGLDKTTIFASGGFDEYKIQKVLRQGADIDSFGVGTKMGVSADAPYFDMAYKLVKYRGRPVMKLSPEKVTLPSEKQVFRFLTSKGKLRRDVLGLRDDKLREGKPLLQKVMAKGKTKAKLLPLDQIQRTFLEEFVHLDKKYKTLGERGAEYPVSLSSRLRNLQSRMIRRLEKDELGKS